MKQLIAVIIFSACLTLSVNSQYITKTYKDMDSVQLDLNIYYPNGEVPAKPLPAIIFFFGGGWTSGTPDHFAPQAEYLSSRGIISITADYRTKKRHGTTPIECISDAKSAVRWLRANHEELRITEDKIAAAGGSAGGHLAVSCALIKDFNDPNDDISVSPIPNALILFNPVLSTYELGYGIDRFGENAEAASPLHQLAKGLPPTLIFHGTDDKVVPIAIVRSFRDKVIELGDNCILMEFNGRGHGFFNSRGDDTADFWKTLLETEKFLIDNKFLNIKSPEDIRE